MSGTRRGGAFWPAAAALLALAGAASDPVAASPAPPASVGADEASSFASRAAEVRYGFHRFEAPPGAFTACCTGSAGFKDPDAGTGFSYVESAPGISQPPARAPGFALTPVPEPSSLVLLLAGIGLFVLRGTVVWQGDHRRRGGRVG